jgi:anthranilate phosphoribosyltransferase
MDPTTLAAAMVGAQMSQMQLAAAVFMMRMNADSAASVVQVIDAAQQNMQSLANVDSGVGQNVNISV